MEVTYSRCAGLDIGKKFLVATFLAPAEGKAEVVKETESFGTLTSDLWRLLAWLQERACEAVAMESTGPYWKPIWNVLEDQGMVLVLTNPQHMKAVPGRKSDVRDSEWIADLLRHGLLKASYVPSRAQRELREIERYRRSLIEERAREVTRLQKVLEGANIKLGDALSNVLGKSGTRILQALADGTTDPGELADLVDTRVHATADQLREALTGYMLAHQHYMLGQQLDHIAYLDGQIGKLDAEIEKRLEPAEKVLERLQTVPGIGPRTAQVIAAEIGVDVDHFRNAKALASWAGLAPGQNESAGKRKQAHARHGNATMRAAMVEAAQAASRTKDTYLRAQFEHLRRRLPYNKAIVALAHSLIVIAYNILEDPDEVYRDLGSDHFLRRDGDFLKRRALHQLETLGYTVTLETAKPQPAA